MESTSTSQLAQVQAQPGDVVRIPGDIEATIESIDLETNTATVVWFNPDATAASTGTFALADLVWVSRGANASHAAGEAAAGTDTPADSATLYDRKASIRDQVRTFFEDGEPEVKEAIREHVLAELDDLGPGAAVSRDGTSTIISAWRNGSRIYGHGTTTAAALADFHKHAGPAAG